MRSNTTDILLLLLDCNKLLSASIFSVVRFIGVTNLLQQSIPSLSVCWCFLTFLWIWISHHRWFCKIRAYTGVGVYLYVISLSFWNATLYIWEGNFQLVTYSAIMSSREKENGSLLPNCPIYEQVLRLQNSEKMLRQCKRMHVWSINSILWCVRSILFSEIETHLSAIYWPTIINSTNLRLLYVTQALSYGQAIIWKIC